jgi:pantoate--beta-alanine ligase
MKTAAWPSSDEVMYPPDYATYIVQEGLTDVLEGACRPGHFRGVLTIVCRLFHIVPADRAYFGHKDFQQSVVVRRMVSDLNMPVQVRVVPTVREPDGLAMSSRNQYLGPEERRQALCLYEALSAAKALCEAGQTDADALRHAMRAELARAPLARVEYAEVVDPDTLRPLDRMTGRAVAVVAARVGQTRLIDNMPLGGRPMP